MDKQREIKFRAWDEKNKMRIIKSLEDLLQWSADGNYQNRDMEFVVWEQYTGLKDNNGKEIYEGDIITFTEIDEDSCLGKEDTHTGKVEWIDEIAQWRFIYPSGQRTELHFIVQLPTIKSCEVIGNIYENPELLQGLKDI